MVSPRASSQGLRYETAGYAMAPSSSQHWLLQARLIAALGCESDAYDFSFRLASSAQLLHIFLLTPSSLEASNKQETVSRLQRFSYNSAKIAVAFLLSEDSFTTASGKYNLDGPLALQVA